MAVDFVSGRNVDFCHPVIGYYAPENGPYRAEDSSRQPEDGDEGDDDGHVDSKGEEDEFVDGAVAWNESLQEGGG